MPELGLGFAYLMPKTGRKRNAGLFQYPPPSFRTPVRGERAGRPRGRKSTFYFRKLYRRPSQPMSCINS